MSVVSANNNALSAISALPSAVSGGALNLISTQTASSSATLDFTSGIDSTYKEYVFKIINVHPATANQRLAVNFRDGSTAFDAVVVIKKCLTNVVLLGSNKCIVEQQDSSLALPTFS